MNMTYWEMWIEMKRAMFLLIKMKMELATINKAT